MGYWKISTETLVRSRFTVSALAETVAALHVLRSRGSHPGLADWRKAHAPAFADRVA